MTATSGTTRLPRAFWVLWAGMLVNRVGAVVVPFLALYLTDVRGVPVLAVGYVLVGFGVGSVLSYLTGGWMADRAGRRLTLIAGVLASAAVMVALSYVRSLPVIMAVVTVLGFTIDLYRPAAAAMVADIVAPDRRAWAYSQLYWAVNLGFAVATLTGGLLARHGFNWLVRVDAATSVAFAVLVWRCMPGLPSGKATAGPNGTGNTRGSYLSVLTDRVMLAYTAISLLFTIVFIQGTTTLPLVMHRDNLSTADYGFAIAMNGVTVLLAQPVIGRWAARFNHSSVSATGMALLGAGFGTLALAHTAWQYAAAVVVWTLGEATVMSVAQAIVAQLAPAHLRGRYNGLFGVTWSCAFLVGPLAGTWMIHNFGAAALWYACLATGLLGAVSQVLLRPAVRGRAATRDGKADNESGESPRLPGIDRAQLQVERRCHSPPREIRWTNIRHGVSEDYRCSARVCSWPPCSPQRTRRRLDRCSRAVGPPSPHRQLLTPPSPCGNWHPPVG